MSHLHKGRMTPAQQVALRVKRLERARQYYVGDDVRDYRDTLATVHTYTGRCERCGEWVGAETVAHGNLGTLVCAGAIRPRRRVTVHIWQGPSVSQWRPATKQERQEILNA